MTGLSIWGVDAFTAVSFGGNPAAVCLLEQEADADWMQTLAAEMNLSETAFLRQLDTGSDKAGQDWELRWFTPATEVDLCGHATLASAHILWETGLSAAASLDFHTRSGVLSAVRDGEWIELDFPQTPAVACDPPPGLIAALGVNPTWVGKSLFDYLVQVEDEEQVRQATPDFSALAKIETRGVMVTAQSTGADFDFVSRFFAPAAGIDEDPVTGSAHCCLAPYWGGVLDKKQMVAYQASARGGSVRLRLAGDRVGLGGQTVTVWRGELA
jgi:predicted PhzF superfamily epimerase YddE/YHI9